MTNPQLWLAALQIGCFFGLVALAYLLVLVGAGFFNFALGPFAMVAGLGGSWLAINQRWPVPLALLAGMALAVLLAVVSEMAVVRPIQARSGRGELPALVAVSALLFSVQQLSGLLFGRASLPGQQILPPGLIPGIDTITFLLVVVTLLVFGTVWLWTQKTATGRMLRAVGDNHEASAVMGLPVRRVRLIAFAAGGLVAAIAGVLYAPKAGVHFGGGLTWALTGFLALVIGGTGNVWAPLVGGLLLGMVQVFAPYYFGNAGPTTVIFVVALIFFAFKPEGLFVRKVRA